MWLGNLKYKGSLEKGLVQGHSKGWAGDPPSAPSPGTPCSLDLLPAVLVPRDQDQPGDPFPTHRHWSSAGSFLSSRGFVRIPQPSLRPGASCLASLCLGFPMCKMGAGDPNGKDQSDGVYENIQYELLLLKEDHGRGGGVRDTDGRRVGVEVSTCQVHRPFKGGPTAAVGQHPEVCVGTACLLPAGSLRRGGWGSRGESSFATPAPSPPRGQLSGPLQASGGGAGRGEAEREREREGNGSSTCRELRCCSEGYPDLGCHRGDPRAGWGGDAGREPGPLRGGGEKGRGRGLGWMAVSLEEAG